MIDRQELGVILDNRPHLLLSGARSKLGELTDIVFKSISDNPILIASYGDLNITAWLATKIAQNDSTDILVCLPSQRFDVLYQKYTSQFFKLTRKDDPSHAGAFAYLSLLWGKGRINEETECIEDIEIESRPKLGNKRYKDAYERHVSAELNKSEKLGGKPKIIFVKYDFSLPKLNNERMEAKFKNGTYPNNTIHPKAVIIESANERGYNYFTGMPETISNLRSSNIKIIVHFSWPYLKGIQSFYRNLMEKVEDAAVVHFGNNLCKSLSKESAVGIDGGLSEFAIEGERGPFFSTNKPSIFQVCMPNDGFTITPTLEEAASYHNEYDDILEDMREESSRLSEENLFLKGLLLFPPFMDSFALPSDLTAPIIMEGYGFRNIPVSEYLIRKLGEEKSKGLNFSTLADGLEKSCDIAYLIHNIHTYAQVTKRTMIQLQIIKLIDNRMFSKGSGGNIYIILADLHSMRGTGKSTNQMIVQLANSLKELPKSLPSIARCGQTGDLILSTQKGKFILSSEKSATMNDVKKFLNSELGISDQFAVEYNPEAEIITVSKQIRKGFITYGKEGCDWKGINRSINKLDLMTLSMREGGGWCVQKVDDVQANPNASSLSIKMAMCEYQGSTVKKQVDVFDVVIERHDFSRLSSLPLECVGKSHLMIPGPVPMLSIGDEIRISEGFDSLLLPFIDVNFFVYPGRNMKRLAAQTAVIEKLFSNHPNEISDADLNMSLEMNNRIPSERRPKSRPAVKTALVDNPGDSPIDILIKNGQYSHGGSDQKDERELMTLKDIFRKIGAGGTRKSPGNEQSSSRASREAITLRILMANGSESTASIGKGTIIRVLQEKEYVMRRVEDVEAGDMILYLSVETMEGIDEYFIRDYAEENSISLDMVYGAFDSLGKFISAVQKIKADTEGHRMLDKLEWLNDVEREALFKYIQYLLGSERVIDEIDSILDNLTWSKYLGRDYLLNFGDCLKGRFDSSAAFKIAEAFGLSLKETTFEQYCGYARNKARHYYFQEYQNIEAIGKLTGNRNLIEDAEKINDMGKKLSPLMIAIGRAISRVISKNANENNPMDVMLVDKLIMCQVLEVRH
ncbi:MAG: hypothetical protein A4E29_01324 [Methanomassiliicoccales archaeon PtaB.Bin134]|nr:MAG: hypothetical protein A4E29_01324 [Methanomassiliicoccales archaeon PtaB.Bin134]